MRSVRPWRRATIATPGEWQCKTGGVRRLAVANGPNIFQMLLVYIVRGSFAGGLHRGPTASKALLVIGSMGALPSEIGSK